MTEAPETPLPGTHQAVASETQEALWLLEALGHESAAHTLNRCYRIAGELNVPVLRVVWHEVVDRHEALRTTFVFDGGRPARRIAERGQGDCSIDFHDLAGQRRAGAAARRLMTEAVERPFDAGAGPLARLTVVRVGQGDFRLVLTAHRAIADDRSMSVLVQEISDLYGRVGAGQSIDDVALVGIESFSEFVERQGRRAAEAEAAGALDWWQRMLTPPPPDVSLPVVRQRPAQASGKALAAYLDAGCDLLRAVEDRARAEGVAVFDVLLAAFQTLLYRHGSADRVAVATPVSTRRGAADASVVGPCVNTLILCADFVGTPDFRTVLAQSAQRAQEAFERRDVPFARVVRGLPVVRDVRRAPLCDAVFMHRTEAPAELTLRGVAVMARPGEPGAVGSDLEFSVDTSGGGLTLAVTLRADLFGPDTAEMVLGQYRTLLAAAAADPATPVDALPLEGPEETAAATRDADRIAADAYAGATVPELVRLWAANCPDGIAVDWAGTRLTYSGLVRAAERIRDALWAAGVEPGAPVVVRLAPGLAQTAALLGVFEAGATLVWFGLGDIGSRGRVVLSGLRPACLVVERGDRPDELVEWYRGEGLGEVVDVAELFDAADIDAPADAATAPEPPIRPVRAADRAYIAYTSGSTGTPKGVAQSHAALAQFVSWLADEFALGPGSRVAQWVAPEHDPALAETFAALASGSTLCLVPAAIRANPEQLVDWLAAERISLLQTVPSFAREILRVVEAGRAGERLGALATLVLMGEALPGELVSGFRAALPLVRTANLYGPTETIAATWHEVAGPVAGPVPIGRSIPGRQVLVLDDEDRPCPAGVTGNLVIRSPYVADGYLGASERAETFAPLPGFPAVTVDGRPVGCYRTGDLARRLPGGVLEYRGRKDFQIKLYGSRLELADVESALAGHPSVAECAVVALTDADGFASRLVIYVVPRSGPDGAPLGSPDEWRTALRHRFGRSMLPALFRALPGRLPRTLAGKVDRARLPDPGSTAVAAGRPPETPVEKEMAGLWAELTGCAPAAAGDTFFAAGGHSLLVFPLLHRIRGRFGVAPTPAQFYAHQTLAGLSALVERSR